MNNELTKNIRKLAISKQLNFLIGSGTSLPAIPLMGMIEENTEGNRNIILQNIVKNISGKIINKSYINKNNFDEEKGKIIETYKSYLEFINVVVDLLNYSNSRETPRNVNIFTTNYDLFIERSLDLLMKNNNFIFNDGSNGYFYKVLNSSNYNRVVAYKGVNDNYINEIPSINLIKPHGSMNWERNQEADKIIVKNEIAEKPFVVLPTGLEQRETFLDNHFFEMLRLFQLELDKPQSILIVIGFSFQDKHISKMVRRGLQNPELIVFCFCYDENSKITIEKNIFEMDGVPSNFKFIIPKDLGQSEIVLGTVTDILRITEIGKEDEK